MSVRSRNTTAAAAACAIAAVFATPVHAHRVHPAIRVAPVPLRLVLPAPVVIAPLPLVAAGPFGPVLRVAPPVVVPVVVVRPVAPRGVALRPTA